MAHIDVMRFRILVAPKEREKERREDRERMRERDHAQAQHERKGGNTKKVFTGW